MMMSRSTSAVMDHLSRQDLDGFFKQTGLFEHFVQVLS